MKASRPFWRCDEATFLALGINACVGVGVCRLTAGVYLPVDDDTAAVARRCRSDASTTNNTTYNKLLLGLLN